METRHADVWIIGSGAAGLTAAIAARSLGAEVAVIGKSAPGKGTATTLAVGAFTGPWEGLSAETYIRQTLAAGRGLNQVDLVEVLAAEAPARFRDLIDWGMRSKSAPGSFMAVPAGGESDLVPVWGREIVRCLVAKAQELGVIFANNLVVRSITADPAGVRLTAHGERHGGWIEFRGGAAILAAGGGGGLYLHHDNPQRITGDAYALAYEAGAVVQDMEFVQFYPIAITEPDRPPFLIDEEGADLGRIVNGRGEDILEKYAITERPAAIHARDSLSQALYTEIEIDGQDIFLDLSGVSKEDWCANPISESQWAYLDRRYDAWNRPLRMSPVAHFLGGGARIDVHGATNVPGLYAAGEAAGGVHGANRLAGNALTETVVFGHRAGEAAHRWAAGRDQGRGIAADVTPGDEPADGTPKTGTPRADAKTLKGELRRAMWRYAGIRRDGAGLATGLETVREIAGEAGKALNVNEPKEIGKLVELQLASRAAELILEAAARRQESRGVHFRVDFPEPDDANWLGHLNVRLEDGARQWTFDKLQDAGGSPPGG